MSSQGLLRMPLDGGLFATITNANFSPSDFEGGILEAQNIRLGPTLPGFLSPGVAKGLVEKFGIKGVTGPEADVAAMMSGA